MSSQELAKAGLNADSLQEYLISKAENHNCYKHYSSLERIEGMIESGCIYLSQGREWEDYEDRAGFNNWSSDCVNFAKCFSFSRSENVAMWLLYSRAGGAMLDLTSQVVKSVKEIEFLRLGKFENGHFANHKTLRRAKQEFSIRFIDVLYRGESDHPGMVTVKRSDERAELDANILKKCQESIVLKSYPWSYENECRLIVSVPREVLGEFDVDDMLEVSLGLDEKYLRERVINFPGKSARNRYRASSLKGLMLDRS